MVAPAPTIMFASWPVRKGKGKGSVHSFLLRAWPGNGIITFAHIPLVGILSHGHIQIQGKLGNVAFSWVAMSPCRTVEFYYLLFKDEGYWWIISRLCKEACHRITPSDIHSKYIYFFNSKILTSDTLTRKEVTWWPKDRENRKPGYGLIIKKAS